MAQTVHLDVQSNITLRNVYHFAPPVGDYLEAAYEQFQQGKTEATFNYSEAIFNICMEQSH